MKKRKYSIALAIWALLAQGCSLTDMLATSSADGDDERTHRTRPDHEDAPVIVTNNDTEHPPKASIIFSYRDALVGEPLSAILDASEDIDGFDASDFRITGATLKSWDKVTSKLYRLILIPQAQADKVTIHLDKSAAVDHDGNPLQEDVDAQASIAKAPWARQIRRYRGTIDAVLEYQNSQGETASIDMIWIRPGHFMMGCSQADDRHCDRDETTHAVTLTQGFWIARSEITQYQWRVAMGSNPSYFKPVTTDDERKLPVENIRYRDAVAFTKTLSQVGQMQMTLPTEAQWEYAARSTTTTAYYDNYDDIQGDACSKSAYYIGWYAGNSSEWTYKKVTQPTPANAVDLSSRYTCFSKKASSDFGTHYIGQKANTDWRLQDMAGNVAEWCLDWYTSDLTAKAQTDPQGPQNGTKRVVKGGSWYDGAAMLRSSSREGVDPASAQNRIGLRPVVLP